MKCLKPFANIIDMLICRHMSIVISFLLIIRITPGLSLGNDGYISSDPLNIIITSPSLASSTINQVRAITLPPDLTTNITLGKLYWNDDKENITWADTGYPSDIKYVTKTMDMPPNKVFGTAGQLHFSVTDYHVYLAVETSSVRDSVGVYSMEASKDGISTKSSVVMTSVNGNIYMTHRTQTVGIGESVTISLQRGSSYSSLRWMHNYGPEVVSKWNGYSSVTIDNVRGKDDGVYECYRAYNRDGGHGIMRLIVRNCPTPKWNPPGCEEDCPVCYNGGVCDDKTGKCVCPAGFAGDQCKVACELLNPTNRFGRNCEARCSDSNPTCSGLNFCPPDPIGCLCYIGWSGNICYQACSGLNYGANCLQTCHCSPDDCDNERGCYNKSATCSAGYTGPGCQELKNNLDCPSGFFGVLCNYRCHCKHGGNCNRDGSCDNGCDEHWAGYDCSIALPYRSNSPTIVNKTATTVTIDATWVPGEDFGTGIIVKRKLWYRTSSFDSFTSVISTDTDIFTIDNIVPPAILELYAQHSRLVGGNVIDGPPSPSRHVYIKCSKPLEEPTIEIETIEGNGIIIKIEPVSDAYDRIQCSAILRYQVRYRSLDETVNKIINTTDSYHKQVNLSGLSKCVAYDVAARVVNNEGIAGDWGQTVHIPPSAPSLHNDSIGNETSLLLKWQAVDCKSFDNLVYHYQLLHHGILQEGTTSKTEVLFDVGIEPCELYTFNVWTSYLNSNGSAIHGHVFATNYPGVPSITSLTATESSIDVHWSPPKDGSSCDIVQYNVTVQSNLISISKHTCDTHLHITENIQPGTEYNLKVAASTSKGFGDFSPISVIRTEELNNVDSMHKFDRGVQLRERSDNQSGYVVAAVVPTTLLLVVIIYLIFVIRKKGRHGRDQHYLNLNTTPILET